MSKPEESTIEARLQSLQGFVPDSDATSRVIEATRQRLLASSTIRPPSTPVSWAPRYRMLIRSSLAATAAVVIALFMWPGLSQQSHGIAFAEVAKELERVKSLVYEIRTEREGLEPRTLKVLIRSDGFERSEGSSGRISIRNRAEMVHVEISPAHRHAVCSYAMKWNSDASLNAIEKIRTLHQTADAASIAPREIGDQSCPGFQFVRKQATIQQTYQVWIDPRTRLPIHVVVTETGKMAPVEELKNVKPGGNLVPVDELVDSTQTITWSNFKYDVPLNDGLFHVTIPKEYQVEMRGTPPANRRPFPTEKLVIKPGVGLGDAVFGMTKEELIEIFGEPEVIEKKRWSEDDLNDFLKRQRNKDFIVTGEREWEILKYNSSGFWLEVRPVAGFRVLTCWGYNDHLSVAAPFGGKTTEGIGIGSTGEEVIAAYGEPVAGQWKDVEGGMLLYQGGEMGDSFSIQTRDRKVVTITAHSYEGAIKYAELSRP